MSNPFLSIVTACFNSEKTITNTINSILNQDFTDYEYIIVDGNSSDNTINIIKNYIPLFKEKNISFKWISENDHGIYNAWNKGLKLAKGGWISFLGSDDMYIDGALKQYANIIYQNKNEDYIYSKVKIFDEGKKIREINKKWNWHLFKKSMNIAHAGAFHNMDYFKKFGLFNEEYRIAGDYEMLLRAKNELNAVFMDEFTVIMLDGGISKKMFLKAFKEAEKAKIQTAGLAAINVKIYSFNLLVRYVGGKILRKIKFK